MTAGEERDIRAEPMSLEVVWRNPLTVVQESLRFSESYNPYYRWAEQERRIRARRANWNVNHRSSA